MTHPANPHLRAYLASVASLPGGELHERDGVLWCRTGIRWPMFNGAIASADGDGAADAIASLVEAGLPWFAWQLPDSPPALVEAAARAGAREFDRQAPWMQARIADLDEPDVPAGVTIEEVADEAGHRLWAATMREIYGFPELRLVTLFPLKRSGEEVAGFFSTEEGTHLYQALGFEENGWVSRWLGGL